MKHSATMLALSLLLFHSCNGQGGGKPLKLSGLKFQSIFGSSGKMSKNVYCLLGLGFFRTPRSADSDSLIAAWMSAHPDADVVPVSSLPSSTKDKKARLIYCWVIAPGDTLNNYLIKAGCFPGGTMERPKTLTELDQREKELYAEVGQEYDVTVYMDKQSYEAFLRQIKAAELYAKENRLGVWSEGGSK